MIDISSITAIDVHTHVQASIDPSAAVEGDAHAASVQEYFGSALGRFNARELAEYYRARNLACVAFSVDAVAATGREPAVSNEEIAEAAAANSDVMIPFASIDPSRGRAGVARARTLISEHGVKGFKFHPSVQAFWPNDRSAYPLYEVIAEAGLPAMFHTGQTGVGAHKPGGGGVRLKYSNPMTLDDVAVDFPELTIILAHPSFPWQEEALAVAGHKPNVFIDLSGWSPKYFPPILVQYANTLLKEKVLFGSDFPALTPERWLADFAQIPIKDEVRPLILKGNAARALKLTP